MKKQLFNCKTLFLAMSLCAVSPSFAQASLESTSTTIYDFAKFNDFELLKFFAELDAKGRKFPTIDELKAKGLYDEIEFVRSHVAKRNTIDNADRLIQKTYAERELFLNLPSGAGKLIGGYPSKDFVNDNFSMWNYTTLFGSWNHNLFQAPGSWVDAAHQNGTDIMSGIKFFDTTGNRGQGANQWMEFIAERNANDEFKYARPLINLLRFLGMDGINYNWETSGYNAVNVVKFHKRLYEIAKEEQFNNFHIVIYTMSHILPNYNVDALFGWNGKRTAEVMLNYEGNGFTKDMNMTYRNAKNALKTTKGLYMGGWIAGMDKNWSDLDKDDYHHESGIALWGEHDQSRFWSYNKGNSPQQLMTNYQMLLERAFSGGYRNPANRPTVIDRGCSLEWQGSIAPLHNFAGMATWIPEQSTIQGKLPFSTFFNLGNGERYVYKGKKTAGSWYNMSNQDLVPTYRWLIYRSGTESVSNAINAQFCSSDAYMGGSCLQINGTATDGSADLILYKTHLEGTSGNIVAKLALKNGKDAMNSSQLYLIVRLKNSKDWKEYLVANPTTNKWEEQQLALNDLTSGDVIDRIGLRVKNTNSDFNMLVGKLELSDNFTAKPTEPKDLTIQVKEEKKTSLSIKASWNVDCSAENELQQNDKENIHHFEILYKNGKEGAVTEIARTKQWAAFVGDIEVGEAENEPYIGVRSASTDLKTYSPVVWKAITRGDYNTLPAVNTNIYGTPELDVSAAGADVARRLRYLEQFSTSDAIENVTYHDTGSRPTTNYVDMSSKVIKVRQGQEFTIHFKGHEATDENEGSHDDLRYCIGRGWIDLDGDGMFNPDLLDLNPNHGECLFTIGTKRSATFANVQGLYAFKIKVPKDAKVGKSRIRIVFSDAWFEGSLQPTGKFNKGFAIDFGVEISGDNPSRKPSGDTWDDGTASEPEGLNVDTGVNTVETAKPSARIENQTIVLNNVQNLWVYTLDGVLVRHITRPTNVNTKLFVKGTYLIKIENNGVIETQKMIIQ
ncbi:MAG: GEVED domain-containing protein [Prevotella sp.]